MEAMVFGFGERQTRAEWRTYCILRMPQEWGGMGGMNCFRLRCSRICMLFSAMIRPILQDATRFAGCLTFAESRGTAA
jgi:hypothetical protein